MTSDGMGEEILHEGRFLGLYQKNGWEYVRRQNTKGVVVVVAITDDSQLILTEQYRPPVGRRVIELPAGLAGDIPYQEDEPLATAALRELYEETGYRASGMEALISGPSSAGMTTEVITFFHATGLTKMGDGGGDHTEDIRVHFVPVKEVLAWCRDRVADGLMVDPKVFAGLFFVQKGKDSKTGSLWI